MATARSPVLQGEPHLPVNRPASKLIAPNPMFETKKILHAKRDTDTEIPSPMKSMGITTNPYDISLACRTIGDTRRVYAGNSLAQTSYLDAKPVSGLSRQAFTSDRFGLFGADFKQPAHPVSTF